MVRIKISVIWVAVGEAVKVVYPRLSYYFLVSIYI